MADGITDTASYEELAGVASTPAGAAIHRKRASTFAEPATGQVRLHKRSSSLVSDMTIDAIVDGDFCGLKCPRVSERFCCSPDALGSPTCTAVVQPPSTPNTCLAQPAALQHKPDNNRAAALPPSPVLEGVVPGQQLQQPQSWQRQPPCLARRSCPVALGLTPPRSPAAAAARAGAAVWLHSPVTVAMLSSSPCTHSCGPAAKVAAAAAAPPPLQLNSLMLVASQLAGRGNGGSSTAGVPGDSSSNLLLPATQAALEATTASVVAAEATAAAAAARVELASPAAGYRPLAAAAVAASDVPAVDQPPCQPQAKQLELPKWLRSGSAGLAASAAICRASLLSTTAALARLSQHQPAAAVDALQETKQQQQQPCLLGVPPAAAEGRAAEPRACSPVLQQARAQGGAGLAALGVPVTGGVVVARLVHPQQQQQQQQHEAAVAHCGSIGRLPDFMAAGACATGQLCMSNLRPATLACGDLQQLEQGTMQCDDASSCCSTPRSGAAAAAAAWPVPLEGVQQVADAAACPLLSSSNGSRRRCCWEAEAMGEEQFGEAMESDGESREATSAAAAAAAAAAAGERSRQKAVCTQQLDWTLVDAAACAVAVVVDLAAERSSSKVAQQAAVSAAFGAAGLAVSAVCCGESP